MTDQTHPPQPFQTAPHRTLLLLTVPVFFSLVAEPLTGLVDTAFVARLGSEALAALGVGTAALSSVFWIFNFLGIGTQTEVAQADGRKNRPRVVGLTWLAIVLALLFGVALLLLGWPFAPAVARLLGAEGSLQADAVVYMRLRLLSAPAMLALLAAFGALRGLQDMRTPLWVAVGINVFNIGLDAALIPQWGIAGAAVASALAQWIGAIWVIAAVVRRVGRPARIPLHEMRDLLRVGGDLFVRTGALTLFLLFTTRVATQIGADAGAAHQAIRQVWIFTALGLDALAITAQSLVGFFVGLQEIGWARRVAAVACQWGLVLGAVLALGMWLGTDWVARLLVPPTAVAFFLGAWTVAVVMQPVNALAFVTDGIHWGTGDFGFLRNVVVLATAVASAGLLLINQTNPAALTWVWVTTGIWIAIRAAFGVLRVWPGIGRSPFRSGPTDSDQP